MKIASARRPKGGRDSPAENVFMEKLFFVAHRTAFFIGGMAMVA
jgi:hypothetical protein